MRTVLSISPVVAGQAVPCTQPPQPATMRLAWLAWLASANAVLFSTARGHRACMTVARVTPSGARLGHPSGTAADTPVPEKFESENEPTEDRELKFLRQLDELKPILSYQGWQKDLDMAESLFVSQPNAALSKIDEMRREQLLHDQKPGRVPPPPPPPPSPPLPPQNTDPDWDDWAWLQTSGPTLSTAMPAASLGPTKYAGYEVSYSDAGTLQIYIPAKGAKAWEKAATAYATVNAVWWPLVFPMLFPKRAAVLRAVPLTAGAAVLLDLFASRYIFKKTLIEPAMDTTITVGRYEWTVVRRTVAGVVTLDKQGATEGLLQRLRAARLDNLDALDIGEELIGEELDGVKDRVNYRVSCSLLTQLREQGESGRVCNQLSRAGVPLMELFEKVFSHLVLLEQQKRGGR